MFLLHFVSNSFVFLLKIKDLLLLVMEYFYIVVL